MNINFDMKIEGINNYNEIINQFTKMCFSVINDFDSAIINKIDSIILSNNYGDKCTEYSGSPRANAGGCTLPVRDQCIVIINYDKCNCIGNGYHELSYLTMHYLYRELARIEINETKRLKAKAYIDKTRGDESGALKMYEEFLSEYKAQSKCPMEWKANKYQLDTFIEYVNVEMDEIHRSLKAFHGRAYDDSKIEIGAIAGRLIDFEYQMCHRISLMLAQNMADHNGICTLQLCGLNKSIEPFFTELLVNISLITDNKLLSCFAQFYDSVDQWIKSCYSDIGNLIVIAKSE